MLQNLTKLFKIKANLFFKDNIVDLNKTELEELDLDEEVLTDNSQESSDSDYDDNLEDT
ncbi:24669_t:CDS:2 [Dentiscutata erythropus]|uniref:24669_t:CDS:1 n=1 Tax=Dentiscutata erythropus TaxID=1348616 RepID=A0A9N9EIN9_9GLOM|nr:24669_t:CDS:2 [Dentiscutata erythropus]